VTPLDYHKAKNDKPKKQRNNPCNSEESPNKGKEKAGVDGKQEEQSTLLGKSKKEREKKKGA